MAGSRATPLVVDGPAGPQVISPAADWLYSYDPATGKELWKANYGKLVWTNQQLIAALPPGELLERARPFLERVAEGAVQPTPGLRALLELLRERSRTLVEMAEQARWLLRDDIEIDEKAAGKHLRPAARPILDALARALDALDAWTPEAIETVFERVRAAHGDISMGRLAQPVRVALTGRAAAPGIFETVAALEPERAVARLRAARDRIAEAEAGAG